ncbi:hypothetical protein ACFX2J_022803 [Malus domestica]
MDPGSLIPHWLTSQGHQYLNRQNAHHQMQAGLTLVVIHEIREDDTQTRGELALSRVMVNGTQSKRGTDENEHQGEVSDDGKSLICGRRVRRNPGGIQGNVGIHGEHFKDCEEEFAGKK